DAPMDSGFARLQLEKYERNLVRGKRASMEPYDFYDVTAWSLPVSYGVAAYALREVPSSVALGALPAPRPETGEDPLADSAPLAVPPPARGREPAGLAPHGPGGGAGGGPPGRL